MSPAATAYLDFLRGKIPVAEAAGFEPMTAPQKELSDHGRYICDWAMRGGRRAIFASFGLHKTRMNLQLGKWVAERTGGKYLIVAPLGVRQEFTQTDGPAMGIPVHFVRTSAEVEAIRGRVFITNYESVRDGKIDVNLFAGVGLDEASILRSFGSKTYQTFLPLFKSVPYRFVLTATPSPNRYKELIHYAAFLGIMDSGEALTRFFQRDSSKAGNLTLYPHMEEQFHTWLASWACFIQRPSDLGFSDEGYDLPGLHVHWHRITADHRKAWSQADSWGQHQLFLDQAEGLAQSAEIKRDSIDLRVAAAKQIVESEDPAKHWLLWHDLEDERKKIEKEFPEAKTVYGSQELDDREALVMGFTRGEYRILATKPSLAGSGCNFQRHCADAVFLGVGYKFNDFIQAIHRIHRFMQTREVHIHIVALDSEDAIVAELQAKWRRHEKLVARMAELLREHRLQSTLTMELTRTLTAGGERTEVKGERFRVVRNDCVLELLDWPDDSVDGIITSIPFGNQYEYSPSFNDFGHNPDNSAFFEQLDHLVPQLLRVLRPGRIACIHVKDRIRFGNVTGDGFPIVDRFSDKTADCFERGGFRTMARITIDTDVVRENNQTYRLGFGENSKDGTKMGAGLPEYVLIFRKLPSDTSNGYADVPVPKDKEAYTVADWQMDAAGFWRSDGDRLPDPEILRHMPLKDIKRLWIDHSRTAPYSIERHVELAKALEQSGRLPGTFMLFPPISRHPDVWDDIARMRTLNSEQSKRQKENHVCPLQLDIIRRLITRYTNPGDKILDPFLGIGSVAYEAVRMDRIGEGIELNAGYWRDAVGFCEAAESKVDVPTLFDLTRECLELESNNPAA